MERVIKLLSSKEEVLFAYIFGSAAREKASKLSDIDIGVYLDKSLSRDEMIEKIIELASELEPGIKVDMVLLNEASPSLAFEVIRGKPLFIRDENALKEFVYMTLKLYHDRRFYDLRWAKAILSR